MTIGVLVVTFVTFVLLGVPISFAMGLSSFSAIIFNGGIPLHLAVDRAVQGVNSFVLVAIPLFMYAGKIMEQGGLSWRLLNFSRMLMGRFRGGLAMAVVVGAVLMAGLSGSMVADVSAIVAMMVGPLERAGYSRPYSISLIGSSCASAYLMPPCILMIIIAAVANVSVIKLFMAGLAPVALLGILFVLMINAQARIYGLPPDERSSLKEVVSGAKDASLAFGIPLMIFVGIRLGIATVTEMAALVVVYALFVAAVIYRSLTVGDALRALVDTAASASTVVMLIGFAEIFSYLIATQGIPQMVLGWMTQVHVSALGVLFISAIIFIIAGSALDGAPAVLIFVPILQPLVMSLHINLLHWLVVVVLSSSIGLFLPPLGLAALMACSIGATKIEDLFRPVLPFLAALVVGLVIIILVPDIALWLPHHIRLRY